MYISCVVFKTKFPEKNLNTLVQMYTVDNVQ